MLLLRGVTALRVKMNVSQAVFAQWLGVSKSLISMVENGNRSLPTAALIKISELEIAWEAKTQQSVILPYTEPARPESPRRQQIRTSRENNNRRYRSILQYRLARMKESWQAVLQGFQLIELAMTSHGKDIGSPSYSALQLATLQLHQKLRRCNTQEQAKLEGKIAMTEIVIASYQPASSAPTEEITGGLLIATTHLQLLNRMTA